MARQPSARHRRHRRFTPRRWLPFVALTALVVGAVMVSSETPSNPPDVVAPVVDATRLPAVTRTDAISTAWYCSGGTATGTGVAELSIVMANDDAAGAIAEVTVMDQEGKEASTTVDIPANGRARLAASDVLQGEWVGALVEVRGGRVAVDREVTGDTGFDASPCSTEASDHWYAPSGSTVRGAESYLTIFNPFPDSASVSITFATDTGLRAPKPLRALSIPGRSVRTVDLGDVITNRNAIAATVRARSGRVVVDRVQTYDGQGDELTSDVGNPTPPPQGLVSVAASPVRAPRWIFPGMRQVEGVRNQIAIYNPGAQTVDLDVVFSYQEPERYEAVEPFEVSIRPRQQEIVDLADVPGLATDVDVWVDVRSLDGVPVVAERLSYFGTESRQGASATLGSPIAASRWMVTQGGATKSRSTTVQVVNPNDSDAKITVIVASGGTRQVLSSASVTVPGGDRRALDLEGAPASATVIVKADRPVVVGSSIALAGGEGISVQGAFPYPETVVALAPVS